MNTVFVPIKLVGGIEITINPQHIASIEPVPEKAVSQCVARMAINLAQQNQSGEWLIGHCFYTVDESRDSLLARIFGAQRDAQERWASAWDEMIQDSLRKFSERDDPPKCGGFTS
jgi:hypothetical protein